MSRVTGHRQYKDLGLKRRCNTTLPHTTSPSLRILNMAPPSSGNYYIKNKATGYFLTSQGKDVSSTTVKTVDPSGKLGPELVSRLVLCSLVSWSETPTRRGST